MVSEIYKKALKVQILNKVALRQVARKRVSFQDRKAIGKGKKHWQLKNIRMASEKLYRNTLT